MEEPSEVERGGVSPPELEVHVLERERDAGPGLVKTGAGQSTRRLDAGFSDAANDLHRLEMSSPSAMRQLSSKLCRSNRPCWALIMRSPPNWNEEVDAMDGFSTILALCGDSYRPTC